MEEPKRKRGRPPKLQIITEAQASGMMPLEYMLAVVRDPAASRDRRDRMAIAAAPFCHPRISDAVTGKKEQAKVNARSSDVGSPLGRMMAEHQQGERVN